MHPSLFAFVLLAVCGCHRSATPSGTASDTTVIRVTTQYPGTGAHIVVETVAAPIEQQMNGAEGVERLESESHDDGSYTLTIRLHPKTDLPTALAAIQARLALADPKLPDEVRRQGVSIEKGDRDRFARLWVAVTSADGTHDALYLNNYTALRVKNAITVVPGVSEVLTITRTPPRAQCNRATRVSVSSPAYSPETLPSCQAGTAVGAAINDLDMDFLLHIASAAFNVAVPS